MDKYVLDLDVSARFDDCLAVVHLRLSNGGLHFAYMTLVVRYEGETIDNPQAVQLAKDIVRQLNS